MSPVPPSGQYASLNGLELYFEVHGTGEPLILLHGGLGNTEMFGEVLPLLSQTRRVIAVDLQGHGRTADSARPLRSELMADDIAALIGHLGLERADLMGYSMGGGVALRTAIQHPGRVRKLVVVSAPHKRNAWYPEVREGMASVNGAAAESMRPSPIYQSYARIAPYPERWPALLDKIGEMMRQEYDWSAEVAALETPTLIVCGDADSFSAAHAAEFQALLGGGQRDAGWETPALPRAWLAILPGTTHYDGSRSALLPAVVTPFLAAR